MRTVCQPITACSQDLGNPAGRWNTISDGVTQTSLFRVQQKEIGDVCTQATCNPSHYDKQQHKDIHKKKQNL